MPVLVCDEVDGRVRASSFREQLLRLFEVSILERRSKLEAGVILVMRVHPRRRRAWAVELIHVTDVRRPEAQIMEQERHREDDKPDQAAREYGDVRGWGHGERLPTARGVVAHEREETWRLDFYRKDSSHLSPFKNCELCMCAMAPLRTCQSRQVIACDHTFYHSTSLYNTSKILRGAEPNTGIIYRADLPWGGSGLSAPTCVGEQPLKPGIRSTRWRA